MVLNIEEPNSKNQIWSHWFHIRIRQYMILEIFLIISSIMLFYKLQTITNQNNQVIEMVATMKSQISILERKVVFGKPTEKRNQFDESIADVLKNMKMDHPINDSKPSKTELIVPLPPLNLNISNIPKKGAILNAADYLRGASVDNARSSRSNLNPIMGYDQTNLVLLDRPQPPTDKAWCSNEYNPVLTINLAKYIKPISVSYQHSKSYDNHTIPMSTPRTYDVVSCLISDLYCENWTPLASNCEYSSQSIGTEQFCNISSRLNVTLIRKVQFRFRENYGDSNTTCVSLVRVYGEAEPEEDKEKLWKEQTCNRIKWYYQTIFVKDTFLNKRCSVLYENDCCSDCPECCEQCVISDYNEQVIVFPIVRMVFLFLNYSISSISLDFHSISNVFIHIFFVFIFLWFQ